MEIEEGEDNISCEATVAWVIAWAQLCPSAGCHHTEGAAVCPGGFAVPHARAGRDKLPDLLQQGCQLPFHKCWQNHLLSTPVFICMSKLSLAIRFWVSTEDEFSVGDCECINTVWWLERQIQDHSGLETKMKFTLQTKYLVEEVDLSTSICTIMASGELSTWFRAESSYVRKIVSDETNERLITGLDGIGNQKFSGCHWHIYRPFYLS